jgi:tetratricopeptide (TPR) repeat protein
VIKLRMTGLLLCLRLLLVLCLAHRSARTAVVCVARSPPVRQASPRPPAALTIVSCAALNLRGGGEEEGEEGEEREDGRKGDDESHESVPGALSDETLELLLKSEAENVGDTQSLRDYADFLQESRKAQDMTLARTLYTRALQLDPACVDTHCSFGRLLHVAGQHDAALRHYKAALLLNPLHLDTLSYSAVLAQERRDFAFAAICYEQVTRGSPRRHACCTLPRAPGKQLEGETAP